MNRRYLLLACIFWLIAALGLSACGSSTPSLAGSGKVIFGTGYTAKFAVVRPRSSFGLHDTVAWVAYLSHKAETATLSLTFLKREGGCAGGWPLATLPVRIQHRDANVVANNITVPSLLAIGATLPGRYAVRYSRGPTGLATGQFELRGSSPLGTIDFGSDFLKRGPHSILIVRPATTFSANGTLAWVAHFQQPASAKRLTITIDRLHGCARTHVYTGEHVRIDNPGVVLFGNKVSLRALAALGVTPGSTYVLRYVRSGVVLAQGEFTVTSGGTGG